MYPYVFVVYGKEHRLLAISQNNLVATLRAMGEPLQALDHLKRVDWIYNNEGPFDPSRATCLYVSGLAWKGFGQTLKAQELFKQALSLRINTFGPDHPKVKEIEESLKKCSTSAVQALPPKPNPSAQPVLNYAMLSAIPQPAPRGIPANANATPQMHTGTATPLPVSPLQIASNTYTERGNFHFERKEIELAIESYTQSLELAERQKNPIEVALGLINIGRAYLEKDQWNFAAKILNGAYALICQIVPKEKATDLNDAQNNQNSIKRLILTLMSEVEKRFLEKEQVNLEPHHSLLIKNTSLYLKRREQLQTMRRTIQTQISQGHPSQKILMEFSQAIGSFLEEILKEMYPIIGKPPCDFALICLGSLARKEMSPYSDLEFALLIQKNSPKVLDYFRKLVKWLEIKIIHLGETEIRILKKGHVSPVRRGLSFDDGGNTPLGKQGYVELIKTPAGMAQFQAEQFYQEDLILSNVLRSAGILVGDHTLYKKYLKEMRVILDSPSSTDSIKIGQERALNLLEGHLIEFEPKIDEKKEETPVFNIKAELYRLPNFLITGLADYFGIEELNTWDKLNALAKINILSAAGVKNLKEALTEVMLLRQRCHLHYGRECDEAFHPAMRQKGFSQKKYFMLSENDVESVNKIFRVIIPLHRAFQRVCKTRDFSFLDQQTFYDNSLAAQAETNMRLLKYDAAKTCFQQAVALNPQDVDCLIKLTTLLIRLASYREAKEYADKILTLGESSKDEQIQFYAYSILGSLCKVRGDAKGARDLYIQALEIKLKQGGKESIELITCYRHLGDALHILGEQQKAKEHYEDSLMRSKKIYGKVHPYVAGILNNLGAVWITLGDHEQAKNCFGEALKINKKMYGEDHPDVAVCLTNLGNVQSSLGDQKKAIEYFEQALRIEMEVFDEDHPSVAITLNNIGVAYSKTNDLASALSYHNKSLRIRRRTFGNTHPEVGVSLTNLGLVYSQMKKQTEAISYFELALELKKILVGKEHPEVASCLNNLGRAWKAQGNLEKTIECFEEALKIRRSKFGPEHPDVSRSLQYLGEALLEDGKADQAIVYFSDGLKILQKLYGENHSEVQSYLSTISSTCGTHGVSFRKDIN